MSPAQKNLSAVNRSRTKMFRNSEFLNQTSYVGYISEENVFIENMNFNNEIPPDIDETDRA